jgi:hypothetical protein
MTITNAAGSPLSEAALNALTTSAPTPPVMRVVTAEIRQKFTYDGGKFEKGDRVLFYAGQVVPQSAIDALFVDATVTSVVPATGPAAGGTDLVITGTNLGGVLGVTIGGTAATMVRVLSETKLTCKAPAHAAGAVNVVVTDDSGPVTVTNGYTYT